VFVKLAPDQVSVPLPIFVRLPLTVIVDVAKLDGIVGVPDGGGYTRPFTELRLTLAVLTVLTLRLLIVALLFTIRLVPRPSVRLVPFTVAPAFRNAAPVVVSVLFTEVGKLNTTCVGLMVFPDQLNVPVPMLVRFPLAVMVDAASVDKIPPPPPGI
jgi:hypothetical protein